MTILQTEFDQIPVVIEIITASAHITYYAHITPSYPTSSRPLWFSMSAKLITELLHVYFVCATPREI